MNCPDCGSDEREDGCNRKGWYWLACDRRYNPSTGIYTPENLRCRYIQLEAENEELTRYLETNRRMNDATREALGANEHGRGTVESIEALKAENERYKEALRKVRDEADGDEFSFEAYCIADKALGVE